MEAEFDFLERRVSESNRNPRQDRSAFIKTLSSTGYALSANKVGADGGIRTHEAVKRTLSRCLGLTTSLRRPNAGRGSRRASKRYATPSQFPAAEHTTGGVILDSLLRFQIRWDCLIRHRSDSGSTWTRVPVGSQSEL